MTGLTPRQAECLHHIKRLTRDDMAPSYEELRLAMNVAAVSGIHRLVHALKDRGYVELDPTCARSIRVLERETVTDILKRPSPELRHIRDQIDRELRKRCWGGVQ